MASQSKDKSAPTMTAKPRKSGHRSRAEKADVKFPVGRLERLLRKQSGGKRISANAPVFLAATLEYLAAEVLELAGNAAKDNKRKRIIPRHICLAIRNDEELDAMTKHVIIAEGGVIPHINRALIPESMQKSADGGNGAATEKKQKQKKKPATASSSSKKKKDASSSSSKKEEVNPEESSDDEENDDDQNVEDPADAVEETA